MHSTGYVLGFATAICVACSLAIAGTALTLKPLQDRNAAIDKKKNVLGAAGLLKEGEVLTGDQVLERYAEQVKEVVIDTKSGQIAVDQPAGEFAASVLVVDIRNFAKSAVTYRPTERYRSAFLVGSGAQQVTILPIAGKGLWSTVYGFLALKADNRTVAGVSFYKHGETPGLGGECEKPAFTGQFTGKVIAGADNKASFGVAKGKTGSAARPLPATASAS
jgi:Na+-transporting NADH:ubiquinone oxidoreductase subunit C